MPGLEVPGVILAYETKNCDSTLVRPPGGRGTGSLSVDAVPELATHIRSMGALEEYAASLALCLLEWHA